MGARVVTVAESRHGNKCGSVLALAKLSVRSEAQVLARDEQLMPLMDRSAHGGTAVYQTRPLLTFSSVPGA